MGAITLKKLKDQLLMDAYQEAVQLDLGEDFIQILFTELKRRGLEQQP